MKHTLKKSADTQVTVSVELGAEELHEAKQRALTRLARDLKVAGFRKGKVPLNVAEKHIDPNLLANETIEHAINKALNDIVTIESIRVLDQPKIELKKFVPYTDIAYEAVIEIVPDITLGNYKKLKTKKTVEKVATAEVDDVIGRLLTNAAEHTEVQRAAKEGDEVSIDFVGKKDGEPFEGGTAKDYALVLGSQSFIPGFEDAIVGMKIGDTKDIPLTFPKDYHAAHLKGAKVVFEVTLNKVQEVVKPKLDDVFAAKIGPFTSVKALKEDIERELSAQKEREADDVYKDALISELVGVSKVPVPEILVSDQIRSLVQDTKQNLMYRGMTVEDYMQAQGYKDEAEWTEKEFRETAIRRVKAGLVLAELSKVENITVTNDELQARHAEMMQQFPNMREQLDTPEARADLVNRLVTEKTLDRLVDLHNNT